jgi:superfamily II DNA or RNA helicase
MSEVSVQDRYDQFQEPAVSNIVSDFTKKPCGRFLLVIPTAGGKTFTGVKAINRLYETGVLNPAQDRVLWTAHRTELIGQAKDAFKKFADTYPEKQNYVDNVDFSMVGGVDKLFLAQTNIKLAVIDEAHHAALKNVTYRPLFTREQLGILGLTATPSRHDGEPLEFERESFSIGFPDLVKKGIVLKPEVRKVEGGSFDFTDLDDEVSLEQLNNEDRNKKIITEIGKHTDEYKKVIIYVGTVNHAKSLYEQLRNSGLKENYESISFITGNENSRNQERDVFIKEEKAFKRSILVNVTVLSEGYDDPSVNTVVMATPSRSKLYYMQAMGRAIRFDPNDPLKKAFCLEIEDSLPNIRYRIDNRWLFSDVSDALEPAVVDEQYGSSEEFEAALKRLYDRYEVPAEQRQYPTYDKDQRFSLLLFKRYLAPGKFVHFPIAISNDNRLQVTNMFNFLAERMESFRKRGIVSEAAFRMVGATAFDLLDDENKRRWVYDSMKSAVPEESLQEPDAHSKAGYPWITFGALHFYQPAFPDGLLDFVRDMVNREDILNSIKSRDFEEGSYLLRLPLPLKSTIGKIVTSFEFSAVDDIVQRLKKIRMEQGEKDHRADVYKVLAESVIPIEQAHVDSLVPIGRSDDPYSFRLT